MCVCVAGAEGVRVFVCVGVGGGAGGVWCFWGVGGWGGGGGGVVLCTSLLHLLLHNCITAITVVVCSVHVCFYVPGSR